MTLDNEQISSLLNQYERESKAIKEDILRLCWFMRGSISYDEGMLLSDEDRIIINKIVNDNMETTKKSGLPFF